MTRGDAYAALGIDPRASDEEIKAAFRKAAFWCHPDKNPGNKVAEETFKRISAAYELLSEGATAASGSAERRRAERSGTEPAAAPSAAASERAAADRTAAEHAGAERAAASSRGSAKSRGRSLLIGIAFGALFGYFVGVSLGAQRIADEPKRPTPPTPTTWRPLTALEQRIKSNMSIVARDPKNVAAWIQIGNDYFDLRQPQNAINAYDHALELDPNSADVLADQGVMYRAVGQFDRAIKNFEAAIRIDRNHITSLFNMGVVYSNDLRQPKKAIEAWKRVIEIAPTSEQATKARQGIEELSRQ